MVLVMSRTIVIMRTVLYKIVSLFAVVLFCTSCSLFKLQSWPEEVQGGVLYFDGEEYREVGMSFFSDRRAWLLMRFIGDEQDIVKCSYYSFKMNSKKDKSSRLYFRLTIPYEVFSTGAVFTSEDTYYSGDMFVQFEKSEGGDYITTYWKIQVTAEDILYSERDREFYSGRFEYEMTMVDTLGISHQVTGWAEYLEK